MAVVSRIDATSTDTRGESVGRTRWVCRTGPPHTTTALVIKVTTPTAGEDPLQMDRLLSNY